MVIKGGMKQYAKKHRKEGKRRGQADISKENCDYGVIHMEITRITRGINLN